MENLNFAERDCRKEFIHSTESGLYSGINAEGEKVIVLIQQGEGMEVWTIRPAKPRWFEVVEYDEEGYQVGVTYKPIEEAPKK